MTTKQQVKNAIKWIDALKGGKKGFKKTTEKLGEDTNGDGEPDKFCCLGVACKVLNVKDVDFTEGVNYTLPELVGLTSASGDFRKSMDIEGVYVSSITEMNDDLYENDETFTNVRKFILKHLDNIFIPSVAEQLIKHYK